MFLLLKFTLSCKVMEQTDLRKVLAQNIKRRRKELGMTQVKLAEYADLSEPYMNDIERCKTWVSDKTLLQLAFALHVNPYELLVPEGQAGCSEMIKNERFVRMEEKKRSLLNYIDKSIESLMSESYSNDCGCRDV